MAGVFVGSDHAGVEMRGAIAAHLAARGHAVVEIGPAAGERADYPDAAAEVARRVVASSPVGAAGVTPASAAAVGILLCGTGIGVSIAANKVVGVRAALVHDPITARLAAEHNGANVLCLGARLLAVDYALRCIDEWLAAHFEPRHQGRLDKIAALEARPSAPPEP